MVARGRCRNWAGPTAERARQGLPRARAGALARAPSGSGWQFSLAGLLGLTVAAREGIEINLLGLSGGFDVDDLALRLPGVGRVPLLPGH
ncbi:MAG: hypothetical protein R3E68_14195 [Burkholderiaceae bacterium]